MVHLKRIGTPIISHLFGGTTATLRQLAARKIFQETLWERKSPISPQVFSRIFNADCSTHSLDNVEEYLTFLKEVVTPNALENLLHILKLPKDFLMYFEVELFRKRLICEFRQIQWFRYQVEEVDETGEGVYFMAAEFSGDSEGTDDSVSEEGDSDLEYW